MKRTCGLLVALGLGLFVTSPSWAQATRRINVSTSGSQANGNSSSPSISGDGLRVAFESVASNLAGSDSNAAFDVFVRKWPHARTDVDSVDSNSVRGNDDSLRAEISGDGDYVVFESV